MERWASKPYWVLTRGWAAHEGEWDSFLHVTTPQRSLEWRDLAQRSHIISEPAGQRIQSLPIGFCHSCALKTTRGPPQEGQESLANPYFQIRHFRTFLNNLAHLRPIWLQTMEWHTGYRACGGMQASDGTIIGAPFFTAWVSSTAHSSTNSNLTVVNNWWQAAYIWDSYCFNFAVAVSPGSPFFQL